MQSTAGITVAICTRNRPDELERCIKSISRQQNIPENFLLELLIVDDGSLNSAEIAKFSSMLEENSSLKYFKKDSPGLLLSRICAVEKASHEIILFLDDDCEIDDSYLSLLLKTYADFGSPAAVGGVDVLLTAGLFWRAYTRLFFSNSGNPGKLSLSGNNGSMVYWSSMKECFETDFLSGCNMSFKKSSLQGLQFVDWLNSYSIGEDIYLSYVAKSKGSLIVNPVLVVRHYRSPVSRDSMADVAFTRFINNYNLLGLIKAEWWRYLFFFWTCLGELMICFLYKASWARIGGYVRAIVFLTGISLKRLGKRVRTIFQGRS